MSQTYISVIVLFLAQLLPAIGINVGTEELTTTIQTLVTLGAGFWILIRRLQVGDITFAGVRK